MKSFFSGLLCLLVFSYSDPSASSELSEILIPKELIGKSVIMEVDWLIEDVGAPKTDFARAIANQLEPIGVVSSISATYQNTVSPDEMYSLEVYEFAGDYQIEEAVRRLKPMVKDASEFSFSEVGSYTSAEYTHESDYIKIQAFEAGDHLIIIGVVNQQADINYFSGKYLSWYSALQKSN